MPIAHQFPTTSSGLLESARQMDPLAWNRLVSTYSRLVWYWCRVKAGLSPEDSADVMQEVFKSVVRKIGDFKKEEGTFRGWLRTITTNKIRDLIRKKSRQPRAAGGSGAADRIKQIEDLFPAPHDEEGLSSGDHHRERNILIHRVLEELRPQFQEQSWNAFWQVKIVGRLAAEVAKELGMTEGAVTQAIHRIRKRLKEELKGFDEFEDFE